jgi:hypothetical protein
MVCHDGRGPVALEANVMTQTILPEGETLRNAVRWISEMRCEQPRRGLGRLIDEASLRFNLTPREQQSLVRLLVEGAAGTNA